MLYRRFITLTIAAISIASIHTVFAFNTRFLDDAPISKMTDKEFDIMIENFNAALDSEDDNTIREWQGESESVGGSIEVNKPFMRDGLTCREASYESHAGNMKGAGTLTFCRNKEGAWLIAQ